MSKNDGGLAFPIAIDMGNGTIATHHGMSLRDYLAAKAMQSLLLTDRFGSDEKDWLAKSAYEYADMMIAEREE